MATHIPELLADVALFRASLSANFRNGQCALRLCHALNYVNKRRDAMGYLPHGTVFKAMILGGS